MNKNIVVPDKFQFFKNTVFFEEMKEDQKRMTEGKYGFFNYIFFISN